MESLDKHKEYKDKKKIEKSIAKKNEKIKKLNDKKKIMLNEIKDSKKKKSKPKTGTKLRKSKLLTRAKKIVYVRDNNICQHCGVSCSGSSRHASHIIPVSATGRLALYPLNMKVMCYHCHINWRHKNPIEAYERFKSKFPKRLEELKNLQKSLPMGTITPDELDNIENMISDMEKLYGIQQKG